MDMTVGPAYGKDYKSKAAALAAWEAGHDFKIEGIHPDAGRYVNKTDAERYSPGIAVTIRYKQMTMATLVKIADKAGEPA